MTRTRTRPAGEVSQSTYVALGAALIVVVVALAWLSTAFYRGLFTATEAITLQLDRSGLLMDPGSDVKLRGVVIGSVDSVEYRDDSAVLTLAITPDELRKVPSNVAVHLEPTTVFGRKFVTLEVPADPSPSSLLPGSTIDGGSVTVEVNDVFAKLVSLLDVVDPQKVNATLGAVATALDGRGEQAGTLLTDLDRYLSQFNGSIPTLQRDIPKTADNLDTFADATPEFLSLAANVSTTGDTVVDKQTQLAAFLASFTALGNTGEDFFRNVKEPMISSLAALRPTTALLARYSPQTVCFFEGMSQNVPRLEQVIGGTKPGLNVQSTILVGQPEYTYPNNLPLVGLDDGPNCRSTPVDFDDPLPPHVQFHDGSEAYTREFTAGELADSPLLKLLYGPTFIFGR